MNSKVPYPLLYLVQEGEGVDEVGGGGGDDPQPDLCILGLGHDGVQHLLGQQRQHLVDGLQRERGEQATQDSLQTCAGFF